MIRAISYIADRSGTPFSRPYALLVSRQDPTVIEPLSFGSIPTNSNRIYEFVAPLPWTNSVLLKKYTTIYIL
jgi:hypothetical protein